MPATRTARRGTVELGHCGRPAGHQPHYTTPTTTSHHQLCPGFTPAQGDAADLGSELARSYEVQRLARQVLGMGGIGEFTTPAGRQLWLAADRDLVRGGRAVLLRGDLVRLERTTNAGFRGIEATVRDTAGTVIRGLGLGMFSLVTGLGTTR
jgi:hypothetical protein